MGVNDMTCYSPASVIACVAREGGEGEGLVARIEKALNEAPAVLEEAPSVSKEFFNPIKTAASLAIGDAAEAYGEALGWPADGETRKRFGIDLLAPALGAVGCSALEGVPEAPKRMAYAARAGGAQESPEERYQRRREEARWSRGRPACGTRSSPRRG